MICSFIVPTRRRIQKLNQSLRSIASCTNPDDCEVILRFDDDDWNEKPMLEGFSNVFCIHGPRYGGYNDLHLLYSDAADKARGDWVFFWNDDAILSAPREWTEYLKSLPLDGALAHPEVHFLGKSRYESRLTKMSPFPIVPRNCWQRFGHERIPAMVDMAMDSLLRIEKGWTPHFIGGMSVTHNRVIDETLPRERF